MKLNWFQIRNFRSIIDSGKCYVNDHITILAGKNESGKSNILKALQAFHEDNFDKEYDFPNLLTDNPPELTTCYIVNEEELQEIMSKALNYGSNFEIEPTQKSYEIVIHKIYGQGVSFEGTFENYVELVRKEEFTYWQQKFIESINELMDIPDQINDAISEQLIGFYTEEEYSDFASLIVGFYEGLDLDENSLEGKIIDHYKLMLSFQSSIKFENITLPNIILFSSFTDLLPEKADRTTAANSTIIQRFFKIVGISEESIFTEVSKQKRKLLVNSASAKITGDFSSFYQQNSVNLSVDIDGDELSFYLYEKDSVAPFKPDQRSQGFQWFLSFYITLVAEKHSTPSIILLDEPGLYLHAKAQKDMLRVLESLSDSSQIIFTTHSPYLIDTNRLDRLKLVLRNETSTYVENKFHKVSDRDTLTPIVTALGYDLSSGLSLNTKTNVIVEGISDYYYLLAMKKYLNIFHDFTIVPSIGVDQIPNIAAILLGWGVPLICLLDRDQQGKAIGNKLQKFGFEENREYLFVSDKKMAIEDLFSPNDFYQNILLEDIPGEITKTNSNLAGYRKAILSRNLFDRISSVNKPTDMIFDQNTLNNFQSLFNKIALCTVPNQIAQ